MSWFKRSEKGIHTKTEEKKDIPKGLWYRTPSCYRSERIYTRNSN